MKILSDLLDDVITKVSFTIRVSEEHKDKLRELATSIGQQYQDTSTNTQNTYFIDEQRNEVTFVAMPLGKNFEKPLDTSG